MASLVTSSRPRGAHVASVARAMRVLEAFAGHPEGLALSALGARLGYGKASLSKILGTLEQEGFVRQDPPGGRFQLTWRLLALAFGHAERVGVAALCLPVLQALADETDELAQLAVVEGDEVRFVAKAEGRGQQIRMLPLVGTAAPLHATAAGKAWLASLPDDVAVARACRDGLRRFTPSTITTRARLLRELREVRRCGHALVDEELVAGGRAVAVAITCGGRVVGAVALSGPTFRLSADGLRGLAPRVGRAAGELAASWPLQVRAGDFGLGREALNGAVRGRPARGV